jgi:hypothetical protein
MPRILDATAWDSCGMGSRKLVARRLRLAMDVRRLVVISRRPKYSGRARGFVVSMGAKWMLLQLVDDTGAFDGHIAFRMRDIRRVRSDKTFAVRAAPQLPHWPPAAPDHVVDLNSTRQLLSTLAEASASGLIGIEKERERYAQWIGVFDEIIGKHVYLLEVHPNGKWHKQPLGYNIRDITSVAIGGNYREALVLYIDWAAKPTLRKKSGS